MKLRLTERNFELLALIDRDGRAGSVQQSSAPDHLWLGVDGTRLHLSRQQVAALVPHLAAWAATGHLRIGRGAGRRRKALREGATLAEIKRECGAVCPDFMECTHAWCRSSYVAWTVADAALAGGGPSATGHEARGVG